MICPSASSKETRWSRLISIEALRLSSSTSTIRWWSSIRKSDAFVRALKSPSSTICTSQKSSWRRVKMKSTTLSFCRSQHRRSSMLSGIALSLSRNASSFCTSFFTAFRCASRASKSVTMWTTWCSTSHSFHRSCCLWLRQFSSWKTELTTSPGGTTWTAYSYCCSTFCFTWDCRVMTMTCHSSHYLSWWTFCWHLPRWASSFGYLKTMGSWFKWLSSWSSV